MRLSSDGGREKPGAVLLDVEGTTTPVEFVYEVLFPFARRHVAEFVRENLESEEVRADISALKADHQSDAEKGPEPALWSEETIESEAESVTRYVRWLMDRDSKTTALKSLQGKIWEGGYRNGLLRGQVYEDVVTAFARWKEQEHGIYIFSSGSVQAQRLLFAHSTAEDLTEYISGYFDTNVGVKTSAESYRAIAAAVGLPASEVLFVSDTVAELDAARKAGMKTALCVRPGRPEPETTAHQIIRTFDELP
ncbi:MAG TPA: acireductone synthase [Pyrinomonadaceae bacterium]